MQTSLGHREGGPIELKFTHRSLSHKQIVIGTDYDLMDSDIISQIRG